VYTDSPDSPTRTAIIAFQAARGLTQDGNVGIQETWPALLGL
jgi:peptidoglycan hydrolase-like protein with peptidoglycan-binding domain